MSPNRRVLRSSAAPLKPVASRNDVSSPVAYRAATSPFTQPSIRVILPGSILPGLTTSELDLLRRKQRSLAQNAQSVLESLPPGKGIYNALNATLIFSQYEAGTAVCIDRDGWILTCAHCFGDTEPEQTAKKTKWLLFYTGEAVQIECRAIDALRDLALAKIVAIESSNRGEGVQIPTFAFIPLSDKLSGTRTNIVCIGQPGRDDLESKTIRRTKYNLIEASQGTLRGMVVGANLQNNSEIGTLKHDAWTYWGHSGAPLVSRIDGKLVGLHSSWDDQTAPFRSSEQYFNPLEKFYARRWAIGKLEDGAP